MSRFAWCTRDRLVVALALLQAAALALLAHRTADKRSATGFFVLRPFAFSPDGRRVIVWRSGSLAEVDLESGRWNLEWPGRHVWPGAEVLAATYSTDGRRLLTVWSREVASRVGSWVELKVQWLSHGGGPLAPPVQFSRDPPPGWRTLHLLPGGRQILLAYPWSPPRLVETGSGSTSRLLSSALAKCRWACTTSGGQLVTAGDTARELRVIDPDRDRVVRTVALTEAWPLEKVSASADGLVLATVTEARQTEVRVLRGNGETVLRLPRGMVRDLALRPDGAQLALTASRFHSRGDELLVWDLTTNQLLVRQISDEPLFVDSILYSPDGRNLAAGGFGSDTLLVLDTRTASRRMLRGPAARARGPGLEAWALGLGLVWAVAWILVRFRRYSPADDEPVDIGWEVVTAAVLASLPVGVWLGPAVLEGNPVKHGAPLFAAATLLGSALFVIALALARPRTFPRHRIGGTCGAYALLALGLLLGLVVLAWVGTPRGFPWRQ